MIFAGLGPIDLIILFLALYCHLTLYMLAQALIAWTIKDGLAGVNVGFGPCFLSFTYARVAFRFSLLPLGGSTMHGTSARLSSANRIVGLTAGPSCSVFLAILVLVLSLVIGRQEPSFVGQPARVAWCRPGSALARAGLSAGDEVVSANYGGATVEIKSWRGLLNVLAHATGSRLQLNVRRGNARVSVDARLERSALADVSHQVDPVVGELDEDSQAYKNGFRHNDHVVEVGNSPINHWLDIAPRLFEPRTNRDEGWRRRDGEVTVHRGSRTLTISVHRPDPAEDEDPMTAMGIAPPGPVFKQRQHGLIGAANGALLDMAETINTTFRALFKGGEYASGFGEQWPRNTQYKSLVLHLFADGSSRLLVVIAFIGLWLGMWNLLPIPGLNGWNIVSELRFMIGGSHHPPSQTARYIGMAIMICLLLYISCGI